MPGSTSTYSSHGSKALVTPAFPSEQPHLNSQSDPRDVDADSGLEERKAMALEGGVPLSFVDIFAVLQVVRPASVDEIRWYQAINDTGVFLDRWGSAAEQLGWAAHDVIDPQFTPAALAWALNGTHVIGLTSTSARLSDGRTFVRTPVGEVKVTDHGL
jgi:hypothetical protein